MIKKIILALAISTAAVEHSFAIMPSIIRHIARGGRTTQEQLEIIQNNVQDESPKCKEIITLCICLKDATNEAQVNYILDTIKELMYNGGLNDCLKNTKFWLEGIDDYIENQPNTPGVPLAKRAMHEVGKIILRAAQHQASNS